LHAVGVLVGGTGLAAAISAVVLPILTRLYTPGDFSVLAVYTSLVGIISVSACLRFDVAIPIPERDEEAANLLALALFFAFGFSLLLAVLVLLMPAQIASALRQPVLAPYLWLVPVGIFFSSGYSAIQYWAIRKKEFGTIASMRMSQAGAAAGVQISFGWLHLGFFGLILGTIVNNGLGFLALLFRMARTGRVVIGAVEPMNMRSTFSAYYRFPKYSALEALSNNAGIQLPIIMIAAMTTGPEAGFLLLALTIIQAPMSLLGTAISQVYLSRAPDEFRRDRLNAFTASVFGGLVKTGVGPLIFGAILAPELFAKIFGEEWHRSGVLLAWMTPWFVMQFVASPISMALHVTNQQKAALVLQIFGFLLRTLSVYAASIYRSDLISETYAVSGFVFYFVYLVVVFHVVDARVADVARSLKRVSLIILTWIVAGILCLLLTKALFG
jgi:O-antigen/teichoic acid export membrane protein